MEKVDIVLGGITRVPDGVMAQDGDMEVLMNVRHEAGEIVPIMRPTEIVRDVNLRGFHLHKNSGYTLAIDKNYVVCIDEHNNVIPITGKKYREKTYEDYVAELDMREELLLEERIEGTFLYRMYSNGVMFLDGQGDIPFFSIEEYSKDIKTIVCSRSVSSIYTGTFEGCINLETVILGDGYRVSYNPFPQKKITIVFFGPPPTVEVASEVANKVVVPKEYYMDYYDAFYAEFGAELELLPNIEEILYYEAKSISTMGNIVIITTDSKCLYAIWRSGCFVFLGELPAFPKLTFVMKSHTSQVQTSLKYDIYTFPDRSSLGDGTEDNRETDTIWWYARKGFFDAALNELYEDGDFVDRAMFRGALRLFDGSYVSLSQVFLVCDNESYEVDVDGILNKVGPGVDNFAWSPTEQGDGRNHLYNVYVKGFNVDFLVDGIPEEWRDIIVGIDIFTTGSIMDWEVVESFPVANFNETVEHLGKGRKKGEVWRMKKPEDLLKEISNADVFYKVASYDINGSMTYKAKNTAPSRLAVNDTLRDGTVHALLRDKSFTYNNKLHVYDFKTVLFNGYEDFLIKQTAPGSKVLVNNITSSVELELDNEKVTIVKSVDITSCAFSGKYLLPPLLIYPDSRAVSMTVYVNIGETVFYKKFPMKKHETMNIAYYIENSVINGTYYVDNYAFYDATQGFNIIDNEKFFNNIKELFGEVRTGEAFNYRLFREGFRRDYITIQEFQSGKKYEVRYADSGVELTGPAMSVGGYYLRLQVRLSVMEHGNEGQFLKINPIAIDESWQVYEGEVPQEGIVEKHTDDVLRVSAVDNPFFLPTQQTYKFDSEIVNLASNTEALSQGQFGQYPLFVFTKNGIWSMAVDTSGQGAYVSQTPFSREVCNGEVLPISGGVVFNTDKGVMAISGGEVIELSQVLDGTSPFMHLYNDNLFKKIYELAGYSMMLTPVNIKEYVKGAKLAYNYKKSEIVVCNYDYGFSYVYGLKTQKWSMTDVVFTDNTNSYPELVTHEENVQMQWNEEKEEEVPVVIITRPIKCSRLDYKRLRQAALRCVHYSDLYFYVLGSNDGVTFSCIAGKEAKADKRNMRDLITSMSRSRMYKFFSIVVTGQLDVDARLSMMQLLVDAGFADNKLR